jgi:hypothetical protein
MQYLNNEYGKIFRGCVFGPHSKKACVQYNCSHIFKAADHILYVGLRTCTLCTYSIYGREYRMRRNRNGRNVQLGAGKQTEKTRGLVWRNRKKISQIIKDYFRLPFFLLIILCCTPSHSAPIQQRLLRIVLNLIHSKCKRPKITQPRFFSCPGIICQKNRTFI